MTDKIGRYEILEELGKGSMGVVYRGRDTIIDRVVAVKTIKMAGGGLSPQSADAIKLFYQEARIAGKLHHPNIATIFDVGEDRGIHYLVFEYVRGVTIKSLIAQKKHMPLNDKLSLVVLIARALHFAHQRGVIHRDIKPANIMVLQDMQVKILDFGIAAISSSDELLFHAHSGVIMGTPSYMSPEQIEGLAVDRQSDIYSLGALAYEFVSGTKPFISSSLDTLRTMVLADNPIAPHLLATEVNEHLSKVILKALEKDRKRRYQSANDFADAIEIYLNATEIQHTKEISPSLSYDKQQLIHALKTKYTFFADFTDEELHKVFSISAKKMYRAGDVIFRENTIGDKLYVIITGKVRITKKMAGKEEEMPLSMLKQGDCFGEMAILDNSPRYATATAEADCILIAINEAVLRNSEPGICLKLYKNVGSVLSEKLKKSDATIIELWGKIKKLTTKGAS